MNNFLRITALLALVALPASAASFTVHNTGGGPEGLADPNWVLSGGTAFVTINAQMPVLWLANGGASRWISPHAGYPIGTPRALAGTYTYSTTFDLTGLNPNTASLSFLIVSDNHTTDVRLNGVSQGITHAGLDAFSSLFTVTSDFVAGINTIEFVVNNANTSPSGLRVEFSSATADALSDVPEPSSIALLGFGTVLFFSRRLRKAK